MTATWDMAELYEACAPLAYRRARHLLGNEAEAWDIVHDVFERVMKNPRAFRGASHPMTYIYRATTNACINLWQHAAVRADAANVRTIAAQIGREGPLDEVIAARDLVTALWDELDTTDQRIVLLHFFDRLPQAEVAEVLGIWRRTVGRRLRKIREAARRLSEEGP